MIKSLTIEGISELDYNYSIGYLSNNNFRLTLSPKVSFT